MTSQQMDGSREERLYHCQNWRGDVVRRIASTGVSLQAEGARFSSYGVPFGLPFGDTDADGDSDTDDLNFIAVRSGDGGA